MRDAATGSRLSFPVRVFFVGAVLTVLGATVLHQWVRVTTARHVDEQAANVDAKIMARLGSYLALLRGGAAFLASEDWVTRARFHRYFDQVEIPPNYPGLQGVGLSVRLSAARVPDFIARVRRDEWPLFRVWPPDPRDEYHSILYLEPEDARNLAAIGYDMHTEPVRRAAMDLARDTGHPAVTGTVTLVQEISSEKQPGFLIYAPFYEAGSRPATETERRQRLVGYAYAACRAGDFMNALVEPATVRGISVSVYDGPKADASALIFRNDAKEAARREIVRTRSIRVLDRTWTLVCAGAPNRVVSPVGAGLLGIVASAGVALLFRGVERARRRAEESEAATREREGELALLIDAVPALVAYVDRDCVVHVCNSRYAEALGMKSEALVGRALGDLLPPDSYADMVPFIRRALNGQGGTFERWVRSPGAGARYLGTIFVPHSGEGGKIIGFYSLSTDLTTHKQAEESARFVADCGKLLIASMDFESTTRGMVHLAVPRVADLAVLFRAEGVELRAVAVSHFEDATERQLGDFLQQVHIPISSPNKIGLAARTGSVVVSTELAAEDLDRAGADEAQRGVLRRLELRSALHIPVVVRSRIWAVFSLGMVGRSGRQFSDEQRQLADEISTRIRLAVENALLYREAQQEIEDRRRAERVARETEERFRLLVEGVRDYAIMALDAQGHIESWNEGAMRILGYEDREVLGVDARRLFAPEDQAQGLPERELARANERGAASDERWFVRKDGSRFWASSHLVVLRDDDRLRGYAWIMRDLTDRKRMEDELERRVQLRTIELNEAVQELEAFSYSVSHDLRAPLRTIRGFTEMTLEEAGQRLNEEERGYLNRVRRASARLEQLISDLLAYTRVSKTRVEIRPVDLHALVSDIQHEHPEFQPPRADVAIEGTLMPAMGNEAYLTQCITNLVGNAVKFVRPGDLPRVRLRTERRGDGVRLLVTDNGIGIPPERLSRAFEIFERLHTTSNYEGTGVGLAIVRRAVQRMNGSVGVESTAGAGTTFWIELQAAD